MTGISFSFPWEVSLMTAIQSGLGPFGVAVASFFTLWGEALVPVGLIGFLYWVYDKEWAKKVAVSLLTILMWGPMIKNVVWRRRPYFDHESIRCLKAVDGSADIYDIAAQGYSFPSGHAASAAAAYLSLAHAAKRKPLTVLTVVLTVGIGISRFCLGVHYPTDVAAGWALGLFAAFFLPQLGRWVKRESVLYAILLASGVPGLFYCTTNDFFSGYGLFLGLAAGLLFEKRYVNFEKPKTVKFAVLRLIFGFGVFLSLAEGLKLILPANFATRVLRYALGSFVAMGVYPMAFRPFESKHSKNGTIHP